MDLQVAGPFQHVLKRPVILFNRSEFGLPLSQIGQSLVERAILLELGFLTGLVCACRTSETIPSSRDRGTGRPVWGLQYAEDGPEAGLHVGVELLRIGEAELRLGQPE